MLGERFATVEGDDNSIFRFIEEITKEIEQLAKQHAENEGNTEKQEEIEEKKLVLKMRLILLRLDQQLLNQSIAQITKYVSHLKILISISTSTIKFCTCKCTGTCITALHSCPPY